MQIRSDISSYFMCNTRQAAGRIDRDFHRRFAGYSIPKTTILLQVEVHMETLSQKIIH
jgi:hypothetical protein